MKTLGCLAHLAIIAVLTMAIDRTTGPDVAPVLRPWVGLAAAVLLVLGGSNFLQLLRGYGQGDRSRGALLARAATGELPAEGGPMVVTGTSRAEGPLIRAPLSGEACVAYQYRMFQKVRSSAGSGRRQVVAIWWGLACQPFFVDAGGRAVRVAAMPELVDTPSTARTDDVVERARAYVEGTPFEETTGIGLVASVATMVGEYGSEQSTGFRRDWHRAGAHVDPADLYLEETVLRAGVEISVAGHWSPERHALVPEPGGVGVSPVTAAAGGPQALLRRATALPHSALSVALLGALLLALGAALVWASGQGYLAGY